MKNRRIDKNDTMRYPELIATITVVLLAGLVIVAVWLVTP